MGLTRHEVEGDSQLIRSYARPATLLATETPRVLGWVVLQVSARC